MSELLEPVEPAEAGAPEGVVPVESDAAVPDGFTPVEEIEPSGVPEGFTPVEEDRPLTTFGVASASEISKVGREFEEEKRQKKAAFDAGISSLLGPNYDGEGTFSGGFEGFVAEMDISRSERLEDKQRKFRDYFPEGSLIRVPVNGELVLLARPNNTEPYRTLSITPEIAGVVASEPFVGGMAGSGFGPVGTALGTVTGVLAQGGVEKVRGFTGPSGTDALIEGGIAGVADAATRGAGRLVFGRNLPPSIRDSMVDAMKASEELGLEPLAVGQTGGPFLRGMFRQVGVTSPRIELKISAQEESLYQAVKAEADPKLVGLSDDALHGVIRAQQKELSDLVNLPPGARTAAGDALERGVEFYRKSTGEFRNRLYSEAIALSDDVTFDLSPAKSLADEIDLGTLGKGREVTREVESPILDASGRPVRTSVTETEMVQLGTTPQGELANVVDAIKRLDPLVSKVTADGQEWTAFEQIKTLRTRLFDLKSSDDGAVRREASKLWRALTGVMDNPISGDPDFVAAYRNASAFNWIREDTLDKTFVTRLLRSDTPEAVGRRYMAPGHFTELLTIRDMVPRPRWDEFRRSFMTDIMSSPTAKQGLSRLQNFQSFDEPSLRLMVSKPEQDALETYLRRKAVFEASPTRKLVEREMTEAERFVAMAKTGTAGELEEAIRLGGEAFRERAKAGIYKSILDDATKTTQQGVTVLDSDALIGSIEKWKKTGKLESLFGPDDWRRIELMQKYAAPISETADIGGGMMAGGLRQKAISAVPDVIAGETRKVAMKLLRPLISNDVTALMLSRPASYGRLQNAGTGRRWLEGASLGLFMLGRGLSRSEPTDDIRKAEAGDTIFSQSGGMDDADVQLAQDAGAMHGSGVEGTKIAQDHLPETTRAYLMAGKSAITGLGFDTRDVTLQRNLILTQQGGGSLAGFYDPANDTITVHGSDKSGFNPSVLNHESAHRGFSRLLERAENDGAPENAEAIDDLRFIMATPSREEAAARLLHHKAAGTTPTEWEMKKWPFMASPKLPLFLESIEQLAAKHVARRKPGGPR